MMGNDKISRYEALLKEIVPLIEDIGNWVGIEANVSAAVKSAFPEFFWVGFYNVEADFWLFPCFFVLLQAQKE